MTQKIKLELNSHNSLVLVWCPAGEFDMGIDVNHPMNQKGGSYSSPKLHIKLTQGFWIAETPLTYAQLFAVKPEWGKNFEGNKDFAISNINWRQCFVWLQTLTSQLHSNLKYQIRDNYSSDLRFDFPTEAQWEYACRAGTDTVYFWGDDSNLIDNYAILGHEKKDDRHVKQKLPNPWGLYDMYGLVEEWCRDDALPLSKWRQTIDPFIDKESPEVIKSLKDRAFEVLGRTSRKKSTRGGEVYTPKESIGSPFRDNRMSSVMEEFRVGLRVVLTSDKQIATPLLGDYYVY